ncbi:hypothetical protein [Thermophilibacter provencensis]|uniref:hypothetical protein n=1 Tax=Thermophilibacter provencensis TaxID=1852386 RepID=UPI00294320FA|nr:hypothetical protein [Thermophilibacter provencensis]
MSLPICLTERPASPSLRRWLALASGDIAFSPSSRSGQIAAAAASMASSSGTLAEVRG